MLLLLKTLLASVFLIVISTLALGGHAYASGGTFTATSTAPGSDGTCEVEVTTSGAGALTITTVSVGGVVQTAGTEYVIIDNGSSTPEVHWLPGHEPAKGAAVNISGTTAGGSGNYTGKVNW